MNSNCVMESGIKIENFGFLWLSLVNKLQMRYIIDITFYDNLWKQKKELSRIIFNNYTTMEKIKKHKIYKAAYGSYLFHTLLSCWIHTRKLFSNTMIMICLNNPDTVLYKVTNISR